MFLVSLKEPKEKSRKDFESWLKLNYPNIPLIDFSIK
jgi:hypothetical protein